MIPKTQVLPSSQNGRTQQPVLPLLPLFAGLLLLALPIAPVVSGETPAEPEGPTGLIEHTPEEAAWMLEHFPLVKKIRPNKIAFDRVNAERQAQGKQALLPHQVSLAALGDEAVFIDAGGAAEPVVEGESGGGGALPGGVDNSTMAAFPPIGQQKNGSCVAWASTYYALTYETALVRGWDAKTVSSYRFSTKWVYNMINNGVDNGSSFSNAWNLLTKHGAPRITEFPQDTNYLNWCLNPTLWRTATTARMGPRGTLYDSNPDNQLALLKQHLANGHLVVYGTYVTSWDKRTILNDPATSADDAFAGQAIARYMNDANQGAHAMTIVGYNDSIWCDVNLNTVVDAGEKGAFKVANSWGTGDWNAGFRWVAYDAVRATSAVSGGPTGRRAIFTSNGLPTWITALPSYTPKVLAEFTVNHAKRSQLRIKLGIDDTSKTIPATGSQWTPGAIYGHGGSWAFDGTTVAIDGTFVFDYSDLNPPTGSARRYFISVYDSVTGDPSTIKSFRLIDADGNVLATSSNTPKTADASEVWCWVDHTLGTAPTNAAPTVATAAAAAPTTVTAKTTALSVLGADDGGEAALVYTWTASGPASVSFSANGTNAAKSSTATFSKAGSYTFTVTIKDAGNLTVTSSVAVTVSQTLTTVTVSPSSASVIVGGTQSFTAVAKDQFGNTQSAAFTWTVSGGGTISSSGLFTAGSTAGGPFTVTATSGGKSGTAQVTVTPPANIAPTIVSPATATPNPVINQSTTSLFVSAGDADSGPAALTYTWSKISGPGTVSFSPNGSAVSNVSTATFGASGSYTLQVTVSDGAASVTSQITGLSVTLPTAPTITTQPTSVTVTAGQTAIFSVVAAGTAPLTYQWKFGTTSVGTNSATLTILNAQASHAGNYKVIVTNSAGSVTSNTVTLTVNPAPTAPSIVTQPASLTVMAGQSATFSVSATGTAPLTYQWKFGTKIVGSNSASLTISSARSRDAGTYTVTISNAYGSVTSVAATLTVTKAVRVTSGSLAFATDGSGGSSSSGYLTVTNDSPDTVTVSATTAQVWLNVTPGNSLNLTPGGSGTYTVAVDPTGLSGTLYGEVDLYDSASDAAQAVPVSLTVSSAPTPAAGKRAGCALGGEGSDSALWLLLATALATLTLSLRRRDAEKRA